MSFRTVVITNQSKLSYKNRYLVVKKETDETYVHLSEIDTVIVDSTAVSISSFLLKELCDSKINIIFCDERHNPFGELTPFYSSHNSSKKISQQSKWTQKDKDNLWTKIVKNKITNQALLLSKIKSDSQNILNEYISEIKTGDSTNREGHAAKVYFNSLFGMKFVRNASDDINAALNYGYAVLLSTFNKEIVCLGYITQLGIHHKNEFNEFNLACDLMEPFRVIIDNFVYYNQEKTFDSNYKMALVNLFNNKYYYNKKSYVLKDIIKQYTKYTLDCLNEKTEYKDFIYYEE